MKVLTVRQPWAGLIACGLKDIENRTWKPDLAEDERFAIHAGRLEDGCEYRPHLCGDGGKYCPHLFWRENPPVDHPLCHHHGVVLCTVKLVEVTRDADSEWALPGLFHWRLGGRATCSQHASSEGSPGAVGVVKYSG